MPNEPLQNFRAVEPANYSFGSSATIASQPFVLNHLQHLVVGTGSAGNSVAANFSGSVHNADRFFPWISRDFNAPLGTGAYYPVAVPNAYDRIYIFMMYMVSTDAGQATANQATVGLSSSYAAPWVVPMGLQPQTRGFSTSNKLNPRISRLPQDIITETVGHNFNQNYNVRTHGIWNPLPAYSSNFSTSNGLWDAGSGSNPSSYGRATIGTGTAYSLPDDLSISKAGNLALAQNAAQFAAASPVAIGMGHEFQTLGSEEIVCCIGSIPTGLTISYPAVAGNYSLNAFVMGMFLG